MPVYYRAYVETGTGTVTSPSYVTITSTATTASPIIWTDITCTSTTSTYANSNYATVMPYVHQRRLERERMLYAQWQNTAARERERMEAYQAQIVGRHTTEAKDRARELLLDYLTPKQRRTFEKNKWFVVRGGKSRTRYRIEAHESLVANIGVLRGKSITHRLCGHCGLREVPLGDHLLAQKLMLECAEDEFLKLANRHAA